MISQDPEPDSNMEVSMDTEYHLLSNCYVIGERIMDNGFKNAVVDALVEARPIGNTGNRRKPSVSTLTIIYTSTPEHSPARRLMANILVTFLTQMPFPFVNDLVEAFIENKYSSDMRSVRVDPKLYHEA
ncbi:hypothetical protein GGP41_008777 [Bipolaris sorokiniana]|uniref:Uncharacterized protein n=1 Tax=Cochliobolus sativus TaxID=45130 RepID=A0A8H5ZAB0_COCSA|nr:hypothetical protein GGP41_008777 [Bipolaris sorokiniana]